MDRDPPLPEQSNGETRPGPIPLHGSGSDPEPRPNAYPDPDLDSDHHEGGTQQTHSHPITRQGGVRGHVTDSYQQPTHQTSTARVRRPLGHSGGGPPPDTCAGSPCFAGYPAGGGATYGSKDASTAAKLI
ncbi:hypothetical protein AgCh_034995 [Apium graveolens]